MKTNLFIGYAYNLSGGNHVDFHNKFWDTMFRCIPARMKFQFSPHVMLITNQLDLYLLSLRCWTSLHLLSTFAIFSFIFLTFLYIFFFNSFCLVQ